MAQPKKGALAQWLVPMVDATDFASIESGITESDFNSGVTKKFYGVNQGGSAATTSGAISKLGSLVHSGVFRITLKTTENNYDFMQIRLNKTGCAEQIIVWENVDNDDSDIMSALTVIQSAASDAASAALQVNSRVLLVQSRLSDFDSRMVSDVSDMRSMLSDMMSDFQSRVPKKVATDSQLSDMASDLKSAIAAVTATVSPSDISDIASAVWANTIGARVDSRILVNKSAISDIASYLVVMSGIDSDILSAAVQVNSRVLVAQSYLSDIRSHVSDLQSDFQSRVPKEAASKSLLSDVNSDLASKVGAITVTISASDVSDIASAVLAGMTGVVSASDISDIASAVNAILASRLSDILSAAVQVNSRVLVGQSSLSDIYSLLSDVQSDFQSRVPKRVATDSQLSDMASDMKSAVSVGNSRVLVVQSQASDIYSLVTHVQSMASDAVSAAQQVNSRVLVAQSAISDLNSLVTTIPIAKLNVLAPASLALVVGSGSTTTAVKFSTIEGGAPSAVNDFYNGRVIVFTSGALIGQATSISDYDGASTTATVVALTAGPADTVTAVIV